MPTYYARKSGNINAADVWATTPTGTASNLFPTFTNADVLVANSFTITVNVSTTVAEVRNDTSGGATAGGSFALGTGVLLKANVFGGQGATTCVSSSVSSAIEGNMTVSASGGASSLLVRAVSFSGGAGTTLNITGNIIVPSGLQHVRVVDFLGTGGTLNITGNLIGNSSSGNNSVLLSTNHVSNTGSISIAGSITAGNSHGFDNLSTNVPVTVTGTVTGGNSGVFGILNSSTSTITAGMATGGVGGAGVSNASTGTIRLTRAVGNAYGPGNTAGLAAAVGAANSGLGIIEIEQIEYGTFGQSPTSGTGIRLKKANTNVAVFNYVDSGSAKTLIDATANAAMPAASDVRSGVSYASGALTGSAFIPSPSSVARGVPVDNTTGTAVLTLADVQSALTAQGLTTARAGNLDNLDATVSSRLAPSGTLATVTNLTNAPASVTPSDIWSHATRTLTSASGPTAVQIRQEMDSNSTKLANLDAAVSSRLAAASYTAPTTPPTAAQNATAVRTELGTELGRIDAAISTRATPANIPASDITAIKAKTDALNTDRLAQVATTNIVGTLLAQANS